MDELHRGQRRLEGIAMDDYQEELLEARAVEQEDVALDEDATEL